MNSNKRGAWHHDILRVLTEHGPLSTRRIHQHFPERHPESIRPVCDGLKKKGLLTSQLIAENHTSVIEWTLTDRGREAAQDGAVMQYAGLEDDGWRPTKWVHPYRRQVRGHVENHQTRVHR